MTLLIYQGLLYNPCGVSVGHISSVLSAPAVSSSGSCLGGSSALRVAGPMSMQLFLNPSEYVPRQL